MDLRELVADAVAGDADAFSLLVEHTYADTYTLAYRLTGNADDAADVVQDAYIRAFRNLAKFRGEAKFSTWMYRITANCASTHLERRRRNRHETLDDHEPAADPSVVHDPEIVVANGSLRADLLGALDQLPDKMRAVVVLRDVYDLTHDDIATELDISVTAAKVRLHRARKKLRELIDQHDHGSGESAVPHAV